MKRLLFLPGLVLLLVLAGCSRPEPRAELTFINRAEPESLDPAVITGQPELRIVSSLFEGLTSRNAAGEIVPGVAEKWEVSPDGRHYVFHLRKDARWSNGDPVTARDFSYSWKRVLEPGSTAEYVSQLFFLKNAEEYNQGKVKDFSQVGVKAPDDHTLTVELENSTPFFLDLCAFATLMPVHRATVEKHGDDWIKPGRIVSNGPYVLDQWRINDRIRLRANPLYWNRDTVKLRTVDALPIEKPNTSFNMFYSGAVDLVLDKGAIPPLLLGDIRQEKYFHSGPILATYFYRFNVTRKPLDNRLVRRALALAIDRSLIVTKITKSGEPVAFSMTPPGTARYTPPAGPGFDPVLARKLLAEAGYPEGRGFPPLTLLYNKTDLNEQIATEVQQMWKKELGIHIQLLKQEWKVYLNSLSQLDYDIGQSSWVGDYNDVHTFLSIFMGGDGNNRTGWKNAGFDSLVNAGQAEPDAAKREKTYQEAERLLITEEAVIAPLYHQVSIKLYDPEKIGGVVNNLVDENPLKGIYRKK
ncbi:MAG: peptide ABC transporter substrate-binding protein [Verrucomicrobiae bacterium]|nr:peptide ABC transporter substrate-binding protein [Verrucomicrobiae bacterium]